MSYNPPELKYEIQDTLFCLGIPYEYETIKDGTRYVRSFHITETDEYIDIYGVGFIRYAKKKYGSTYELKCHLLQKFSSKI